MAKKDWTVDYVNSLPNEHLLFVYHYLKKSENDFWDRMSSHLGTMWKKSELIRLRDKVPGNSKASESDTIFVPLSLGINPGLVEGLVGKTRSNSTASVATEPSFMMEDGLNTGMTLPPGVEPMANLPKEEFLGIIKAAGMSVSKVTK